MSYPYSPIDEIAYLEDWCIRPQDNRQRFARVHHTGKLTDWHSNQIGTYVVTGSWTLYPFGGQGEARRMASVRAFIGGHEYTGKLAYEWTQAVRLRRSRRKEA